jgi:hypothetical protein
MTASEFDSLRAELAAFRSEVRTLSSEVRTELATLRARIDAKPDTATMYRTILAIVVTMFLTAAGAAVLLKALGESA